MIDFKDRLHELLSYYGINQTEFSDKTGIKKDMVSRYLSGQRIPKQSTLVQISKVYDVNPAWLMGYDVPMFLKDVNKRAEDNARLITYFEKMSKENQEMLLKLAESLAEKV